MRLVVDTNIVISGLLWSGAPARLLDLAAADDHLIFTSPKLLEELHVSLARNKFDRRVELAGMMRDQLFESFASVAMLVEPASLPNPIAPDPDDDWVIATALAAQADCIVTGDKPLLGVGQVGVVRIVTVAEALALIERG